MTAKLPTIEKGVPIPNVKRLPDGRRRAKSPWPDFLESLVPGDSFVLFYPTVLHVMAIAKWMEIPLIKFDLPKSPGDRMAKARIWRDADGTIDQKRRAQTTSMAQAADALWRVQGIDHVIME